MFRSVRLAAEWCIPANLEWEASGPDEIELPFKQNQAGVTFSEHPPKSTHLAAESRTVQKLMAELLERKVVGRFH